MTTTGVLLGLAFLAAGAVAIVQTARARRLRQQADALEADAARARDARDSFFDLATHELRSPLAAILGYQELLQDGAYGELGDVAADPITRIGRSARHLLHLIDGLVELSRLRAGTVEPYLEPVNTAPLVAGLADAFRAHARDRNLDPVVRIDDELPTIRSDHDRLLRAIDLLVTSAIKHPAGTSIHLDVASTGRDLSLRIHPTELTVDSRAEDPELRLGIRLAVAHRVATLLGGHIDLETDGADDVIRAIGFRVASLEPPAAPP